MERLRQEEVRDEGVVGLLVAPTRWSSAKRQRALAEAGMHLLFFFVGLAPWLLVNALFMQARPLQD
jgi:hypothetical protein